MSDPDDENLVEAKIAALQLASKALRSLGTWDAVKGIDEQIETLAIARKALTPSLTPYVRPAAEIRAEIHRQSQSYAGTTSYSQAYIAGLTFALTPPTQEPR